MVYKHRLRYASILPPPPCAQKKLIFRKDRTSGKSPFRGHFSPLPRERSYGSLEWVTRPNDRGHALILFEIVPIRVIDRRIFKSLGRLAKETRFRFVVRIKKNYEVAFSSAYTDVACFGDAPVLLPNDANARIVEGQGHRRRPISRPVIDNENFIRIRWILLRSCAFQSTPKSRFGVVRADDDRCFHCIFFHSRGSMISSSTLRNASSISLIQLACAGSLCSTPMICFTCAVVFAPKTMWSGA